MSERLVFQSKQELEYDRERALAMWRVIAPLIPEDDDRGFGEHQGVDDDDRIIMLFELLNESVLGDMLFGAVNWDAWSDLEGLGVSSRE